MHFDEVLHNLLYAPASHNRISKNVTCFSVTLAGSTANETYLLHLVLPESLLKMSYAQC